MATPSREDIMIYYIKVKKWWLQKCSTQFWRGTSFLNVCTGTKTEKDIFLNIVKETNNLFGLNFQIDDTINYLDYFKNPEAEPIISDDSYGFK